MLVQRLGWFPTPSFLRGVASMADIAGASLRIDVKRFAPRMDGVFLARDFRAVSEDMRRAVDRAAAAAKADQPRLFDVADY